MKETWLFSLLACRCLLKDQRVWICLEYDRVNNACQVLRRWAERWGNLPAPSNRTVMKTYRKQDEGTCHNLNKGRSGKHQIGSIISYGKWSKIW